MVTLREQKDCIEIGLGARISERNTWNLYLSNTGTYHLSSKDIGDQQSHQCFYTDQEPTYNYAFGSQRMKQIHRHLQHLLIRRAAWKK